MSHSLPLYSHEIGGICLRSLLLIRDPIEVLIYHQGHGQCTNNRFCDPRTYVDPVPPYTDKGNAKFHQQPHKIEGEAQDSCVAQYLHNGTKFLKSKQRARDALLAVHRDTVKDHILSKTFANVNGT